MSTSTTVQAAPDLFPDAPLPAARTEIDALAQTVVAYGVPLGQLAVAHRAARLAVPLTQALKVPALRLALVNLAIARNRRRANGSGERA